MHALKNETENQLKNKTTLTHKPMSISTSALVPSPLGSLAAASRTNVKMVTYGGRLETNNECSLALFKLDSFVNTP